MGGAFGGTLGLLGAAAVTAFTDDEDNDDDEDKFLPRSLCCGWYIGGRVVVALAATLFKFGEEAEEESFKRAAFSFLLSYSSGTDRTRFFECDLVVVLLLALLLLLLLS